MSGIAGEKLYDYTLSVTGVVEYGASIRHIMGGQSSCPAGGLRVDVAFEGPMTGRLSGSVVVVHYMTIRADRRVDLDIKAHVATDDGENIALAASGVGARNPVGRPCCGRTSP